MSINFERVSSTSHKLEVIFHYKKQLSINLFPIEKRSLIKKIIQMN
jgi:hypothetical protein